jgi:TonB family protein
MRTIGLFFLFLALSAGNAMCQGELAPSTENGPLTMRPTPPKPDAEGVYRIGIGVKAPVLVHPAFATPPAEAAGSDLPHVVLINAVVGVDGVATGLQVVRSAGSSYDEPAIAAIKQSRFNPGAVEGTLVPVLICLNVRFVNVAPPIPVVLPRYPGSPFPRMGSNDERGPGWPSPGQSSAQPGPQNPAGEDPFRLRPGDKAPVAIFSPAAEFSDEARRLKYGGVVILSLIVTEEGIPMDIRVVRPLDHGLTDKALEAVSQYRFQPALRDGEPVAVRLSIEINFHLYTPPARR